MRKILLSLGILAAFGVLVQLSFGGSETRYGNGTRSSGKVPTFTLDQAILTALQRNPDILRAEQEIKRTKGVIIQVRAQALPQINANANFEWTDPNLQGARVLGPTGTGGTSTVPGTTTGGGFLVG
jgi:outer membrane protein TolC